LRRAAGQVITVLGIDKLITITPKSVITFRPES
jgi:hypothetical protein